MGRMLKKDFKCEDDSRPGGPNVSWSASALNTLWERALNISPRDFGSFESLSS